MDSIEPKRTRTPRRVLKRIIKDTTIDPKNMDLKDWLVITKTPVKDLAKFLKITPSYVYEILYNGRVPSKKIQDKIHNLTMGKLIGLCREAM